MQKSLFSSKNSINCNGRLISLEKPLVMGILNATPDSFYAKSRIGNNDMLKERIEKMVSDGVDIIDVGGYSSRPGADEVSEKEEWGRVEPVLEAIKSINPEMLVSIDTYRAGIARKAVEGFHVDLVNDISAGEMDAAMFETVSGLQVPYIMMHMKGTPQNMQLNPTYDYLVKEIIEYFAQKVVALNQMGLNDIIIDPGFGFGKTLAHNYQLLNLMDEFQLFELPVLVGVSRKSMIYKLLGIAPEDALNGTTAINMAALMKGANILRVHDVKAAKETIAIYNAMIAGE
jgi:dihydropteroate synthase